MNEKITKKETIEQRYRVDNSADAERKYVIKAVITEQNGEVSRFDEGQVQANGTDVCQFNGDMSASQYLNLNFYGNVDRKAIVVAVEDFLSALKK